MSRRRFVNEGGRGVTFSNPFSQQAEVDADGAQPQQHKYVKPRVGYQYQARIPKFVEPSSSPSSSNGGRRSEQSSSSEQQQSSVACGNGRSWNRPAHRRGRPPKGGWPVATKLEDTEGSTSMTTNGGGASWAPCSDPRSLPDEIPGRGGLCVHRPLQHDGTVIAPPPSLSVGGSGGAKSNQEEFLVFARNLFLQTPRMCHPQTQEQKDEEDAHVQAHEKWKEDIVTQYGSRSGKCAKTNCRGVKRKLLPDDDEQAWGMAASSATEKVASSSFEEKVGTSDAEAETNVKLELVPATKAVGSYGALGCEDDEQMLEYLERGHGGQTKVAELSILVDLSRGRANKARRYLRKRRRQEEEFQDRTPPHTTYSWRRRYERMCPTMLGDLKEIPGNAHYPFQSNNRSPASRDVGTTMNNQWETVKCDTTEVFSEACADTSSTESTDDSSVYMSATSSLMDQNAIVRNIWRSILACSQSILRLTGDDMDADVVASAKPSLSELISLVGNAHKLSSPEDVFGSRHSMVERISLCLNMILDQVDKGRTAEAKLIDLLYDGEGEGIPLDDMRKTVDRMERISPIQLENTGTIRQILDSASQWESRLDSLLGDSSNMDNLSSAEQLAMEAKSLVIRPRSLVLLEERIQRAQLLRDRIREWHQAQIQEKSENMKFIASLVREANRVDLAFPEISLVSSLHREAEEWVDRATIAVRSRISLSELESLVEVGETMPLNLSDLLDKLRTKVQQARDWINRFELEVPCPYKNTDDGESAVVDVPLWLSRIRSALSETDGQRYDVLSDLAAEGSRIPVEIDCLKLLQLQIDSRNWSLKANKWLSQAPDDPVADATNGRKGKIEDLREHLAKAETIRGKLPLASDEKADWKLEYEDELKAIVKSADDWYTKYQVYLEVDNRRAQQEKCCVSLPLMRQIVQEASKVHANLGNAEIKMNRILSQAESWFDSNRVILARCDIFVEPESAETSYIVHPPTKISLAAINAAVSSASSDVPFDLEEARKLQAVAERVQDWFDRSVSIAPKRSKRSGRRRIFRTQRSIKELISLIEEASNLPVKAGEELERLRMQLSDLQSWRLKAQADLRAIVDAFHNLRSQRTSAHGPAPEHMPPDRDHKNSGKQPNTVHSTHAVKVHAYNTKTSAASAERAASVIHSVSESRSSSSVSAASLSSSRAVSPKGAGSAPPSTGSIKNLHKLVTDLLKSARSQGFSTVEERIADKLDEVLKWCTRSFSIIAKPDDVFEERYFKEFDKFIEEGSGLIVPSTDSDEENDGEVDDKHLLSDLRESWAGLISDEIARLEQLRSHRTEFLSWCERAESVLSSEDKRVPLETMKKLALQASVYPPSLPIVQRVRSLTRTAIAWAESVNEILKSKKKISFKEAKNKVAEGEKLNISCPELKNIRTALRAARGWASRVKKSDLDNGETHVNDIKELISEHNSFIVEMPEELSKLKEAICGYCICRQPYDGFMIGCDGCDEWYHGSCVGVSEAQAERFDKYMCVRCCISRVYKASAKSAGAVIRKWTNSKDLKKARQVDQQKHQRKVRDKSREIRKLKNEIVSLEKALAEQRAEDEDNHDIADISSSKFGEGYTNAVSGGPVPDRRASSILMNQETTASAASIGSMCPEHASQEGSGTTAGNVLLNGHMRGASICSVSESQDSCSVAGSSIADQDNMSSAAKSVSSEASEKLKKALSTLTSCQNRLEELGQIARERASMEAKEDGHASALRRWCIMVKSSVLGPSTQEEARNSRPQLTGDLSIPMKAAVTEAETLGIIDLPDVAVVVNAFSCLSWCIRAFFILARKPRIEEVKSLVSRSSSLKLPEEKSVLMLRSVLQRAALWQGKVLKALAPVKGETKPYHIKSLQELAAGAKDVPFIMPEEAQLLNTIADGGNRHCLCGGPSDGRFMLGCDKCDRWFHGICVNLEKEAGDAYAKWVCPECVASPNLENGKCKSVHNICARAKHDDEVMSNTTDCDEAKDISPHAPDPEKMWPPFGLADTPEAIEALGTSSLSVEECMDSSSATDKPNGEEKDVPVSEETEAPAEDETKRGSNFMFQNLAMEQTCVPPIVYKSDRGLDRVPQNIEMRRNAALVVSPDSPADGSNNEADLAARGAILQRSTTQFSDADAEEQLRRAGLVESQIPINAGQCRIPNLRQAALSADEGSVANRRPIHEDADECDDDQLVLGHTLQIETQQPLAVQSRETVYQGMVALNRAADVMLAAVDCMRENCS